MKRPDPFQLESPNYVLICQHFIADYDLDRWDKDRIARLCQAIGCSVREVFALAAVFDPKKVERLYKTGPIPAPIALHFAKLERFVYSLRLTTGNPPDAQEIQTACLIARNQEYDRSQSTDQVQQHSGAD